MQAIEVPEALAIAHVVVPVDGSAFAAAALPTARALAARFDAELSTISFDDDEPDVARAISRKAASLGDAVIVMSTRGRGRLAGTFLGSVARSVLATSDTPVIALGPVADRPGRLVGRPRRRPDSWPEPLSDGPVVALVDGTAASEKVLPEAMRWAEALGTELVILTVAEDAPTTVSGAPRNRFGPSEPVAYVNDLATQMRGSAGEVRGDVVFDPIGVGSGIERYLSSHTTALVALSAPLRGGWDRLRRGATAADIVRASTAPVLVVPQRVT
jgi:nucleotide-binding universal stress UspA family protein